MSRITSGQWAVGSEKKCDGAVNNQPVARKKAGFRRPTFHCPLPTAHCPLPTAHLLRRETPERASHVALAQSLQGAVTQLTHAFARHAKHRADFLERVFTSTFE